MNVISDRVKISLEGRIRSGLSIKEIDSPITNVCDEFGSTDINPLVDSDIKIPKELIAGTDKARSSATGYPLPYRYSREFNLAGLNFGVISEIDGKKPEQKIYVIGTILAKLTRVPKNNSEALKLEEHLRRYNPRLLENRSVPNNKGFILEGYFRIIKNPMPLGIVLSLSMYQNDDRYPKAKELHLISRDESAIYELQQKGIIDPSFKGSIEIRPNKIYPGKILEGLRLFTNRYENIRNSPLGSFKEGDYTEIEIDLKK